MAIGYWDELYVTDFEEEGVVFTAVYELYATEQRQLLARDLDKLQQRVCKM